MFFSQRESFRVNLDTDKKMAWLLRYLSDKYENKSHLIRCAIIKLYNEEVKNERQNRIYDKVNL